VSGENADFLSGNRGETLSLVPHGREKNHHVMDRTAEDAADENPKRAGQKTELRRQHRPDQGSRRRNRREVVPEQHVLVGFDVIRPVGKTQRRRRTFRLDPQHAHGDPQTVKAITDRKNAQGGKNQCDGIDADKEVKHRETSLSSESAASAREQA